LGFDFLFPFLMLENVDLSSVYLLHIIPQG
jgi:hypothetical protein